MFIPDPFDLAPGARRHPRAAWIVLAAGVAFAALCALPLVRTLESRSRAEEDLTLAVKTSRMRTDAEVAARLAQTEPVALERIKAQQALQNQLRMSWTSLFDALEAASGEAKGGATVLSLAPVASRSGAAEIAITAMATSVPVMLTYVRSLQSSAHIREVQLSAQQPASSGGEAMVRFQLSLLWMPGAGSQAVASPDFPARAGAQK